MCEVLPEVDEAVDSAFIKVYTEDEARKPLY